jgi:hypothetical protein
LLQDYKPGALYALHLRKALQQLGTTAINVNSGSLIGRSSVTVLSLSSDPGALALGPQLAVFAASQGISTALVVGSQQDTAAALHIACAAPPSERSRNLRVTVSDSPTEVEPDEALTVVVVVVDERGPRLPNTMRTAVTVLGVSAGAATADQLARAATSAAADGRDITGILVANPEPTDRTTGRLPQLARPNRGRMPTRITGITTEVRL